MVLIPFVLMAVVGGFDLAVGVYGLIHHLHTAPFFFGLSFAVLLFTIGMVSPRD